jgi:hypothetical protein
MRRLSRGFLVLHPGKVRPDQPARIGSAKILAPLNPDTRINVANPKLWFVVFV